MFYKYLGETRISSDEEGIQKLLIAPYVRDKMEHAKAGMDILNGAVSVSWTKTETAFSLELEIPFNTQTEVRIPEKCGGLKEIRRNGAAYHTNQEKVAGIGTVLHLGSGSYRITTQR